MTSAILQTIWTDVCLKSDVCFRSLIIFAVNKIWCIATNLYRPNMALFFFFFFCLLCCFLMLRGSHVEKFVNIYYIDATWWNILPNLELHRRSPKGISIFFAVEKFQPQYTNVLLTPSVIMFSTHVGKIGFFCVYLFLKEKHLPAHTP